MKLAKIEGSENYTCQVIKLPAKQDVKGLDKLCKVTYQGNDVLTSKDADPNELYLFFPVESVISHDFLSKNNLFRHSKLNYDKTKSGFFEDNRRVKALKFKGITSTGFIIPVTSLKPFLDNLNFKIGDEFNSINGNELCVKYIRKYLIQDPKKQSTRDRVNNIIDSRMAPEHFTTEHLLKNVYKLNLNDYIAVTYKLHGTSARYFNTLVKRPLKWYEKLAQKLGVNVTDHQYDYVCGSRKCIKSVGFEELPNKNHYYNSGDLWSAVGKEYFEGKLNQGEVVYCEIVGKTYSGEAIQSGYTYGFEKPEVFVYRISNINPQGIELDLSYHQMIERAKQLNVKVCPELFYGKISDFFIRYAFAEHINYSTIKDGNIIYCDSEKNEISNETFFSTIFYNKLLEKPSILDSSVIEEGFCIRVDKYGKPDIYKIKSKSFLLHEGVLLDKPEVVDMEVEQ